MTHTPADATPARNKRNAPDSLKPSGENKAGNETAARAATDEEIAEWCANRLKTPRIFREAGDELGAWCAFANALGNRLTAETARAERAEAGWGNVSERHVKIQEVLKKMQEIIGDIKDCESWPAPIPDLYVLLNMITERVPPRRPLMANDERKCRFCGETNQTSLIGMAIVECSSSAMCRARCAQQLAEKEEERQAQEDIAVVQAYIILARKAEIAALRKMLKKHELGWDSCTKGNGSCSPQCPECETSFKHADDCALAALLSRDEPVTAQEKGGE